MVFADLPTQVLSETCLPVQKNKHVQKCSIRFESAKKGSKVLKKVQKCFAMCKSYLAKFKILGKV